jgi:hypothetical protein
MVPGKAALSSGQVTSMGGGTGLAACGLGGLCSGTDVQAARIPTMPMTASLRRLMTMGLLLLEALGALVLLLGIVWWTMFSGRKKGELAKDADSNDSDKKGH